MWVGGNQRPLLDRAAFLARTLHFRPLSRRTLLFMPDWYASWRDGGRFLPRTEPFQGRNCWLCPKKSPRVSELEGVPVRGHGRAAVDNPGSLDINDNSLMGRIGSRDGVSYANSATDCYEHSWHLQETAGEGRVHSPGQSDRRFVERKRLVDR